MTHASNRSRPVKDLVALGCLGALAVAGGCGKSSFKGGGTASNPDAKKAGPAKTGGEEEAARGKGGGLGTGDSNEGAGRAGGSDGSGGGTMDGAGGSGGGTTDGAGGSGGGTTDGAGGSAGGTLNGAGGSGAGGPGSVTLPSGLTNLALACDAEAAVPAFAAAKRGEVSGASVAASCERQLKVTASAEDKVPADVLFVLDVSHSMTPHIETVKQNVVALSEALASRGIDARFAAIGFVDEAIPGFKIPFSAAGAFKSAITPWSVQRTCTGPSAGGRAAGVDQRVVNCTVQEAGLQVLRTAVQLLEQDAASVPARAGYDKYVMYVSDAMAWDSDFEDFDVSKVGAVLKGARAGKLPGLKYRHSVPGALPADRATFSTILSDPTHFRTVYEASDGSGRQVYKDRYLKADASYTMRSQQDELALSSGVPTSALGFPFTSDVLLGDFASTIKVTEKLVVFSCARKSAKLLSGPGGTVLAEADAKGVIDFSKVPATTTSADLVVERCCTAPGATTCEQSPVSTVRVTF